ncbi:hypothetical protein OKW21_002563 [Catalinimonas alkaloidigena]|nr:hypothetical protein [Catalinimonas alkaloidigena]
MNGLIRLLVGIGISYLVLKVMQQRSVRSYILGALLDGAYFLIKRKLKS